MNSVNINYDLKETVKGLMQELQNLVLKKDVLVMDKIQLGIVGAGLIWDLTHKQKLNMLKSIYEIRAFSVRSESTKNKLKKEYPDLEVYNDYHEMLKLDYLDAIVVLTPIQLNALVTIEALRADKYVFVEKPVATSIDDVGQIIDLEKKKKKKVFVLEQIRYNENLKKLKRILDEGKIGNVVSYELVNHGKIDEGKNNLGGFGNTDWRINPGFPLGSLFDGGIHTIAQLSYLFLKPVSVYALGSKIRSGFGEYDHILMTFSHHEGINGTFSFADYMDGSNNYFIIRGTKGTIQFKHDSLVINGDNNSTIDLPQSDESLIMWQQCAEWFAGKETFVYGLKESLQDIEMLVAVDNSLKQGEIEELN